MSDPQTIKYATAARLRAGQCPYPKSPLKAAISRHPNPAMVTSHPAVLRELPVFQRLVSTEPRPQLNDPASRAKQNQSSLRPKMVVWCSCGQSRVKVPQTPSANPRKPCNGKWWSSKRNEI